MRRTSQNALAAAFLFIAGGEIAHAADWGLAGTLAVTSDYRFRGISQNDRQIAPQGSLNLTGPDGWYVGTWGSKLDFDDHANTSVEWDIYAGKHFDLGDGFDLNVEPYYYAYPNHDSDKAGFHDSYFELITTLTKKFDKLTLAGTVAWSPDWFAQSGTGWYVAGNAAYQINDWLAVSGNLAHQSARDFDRIPGIEFPYWEWDVGATVTWKQFAFDVRYVDTRISKGACETFNGPGNGNWCTGGVVGTVTWNFTLL